MSLSQIVVYKSADCIASVEEEAQWLVLIARVKKYQVVYEQSICRFGYNISRESLLAKYWLLWYKQQLPDCIPSVVDKAQWSVFNGENKETIR